MFYDLGSGNWARAISETKKACRHCSCVKSKHERSYHLYNDVGRIVMVTLGIENEDVKKAMSGKDTFT